MAGKLSLRESLLQAFCVRIIWCYRACGTLGVARRRDVRLCGCSVICTIACCAHVETELELYCYRILQSKEISGIINSSFIEFFLRKISQIKKKLPLI